MMVPTLSLIAVAALAFQPAEAPSMRDVLVEQMRGNQLPIDAPVEQLRAGFDALGGQLPLPEGATITRVEIGEMAAAWIRTPNTVDDRTLLYLHGGGYVIGSIDAYRSLASHLGDAAGCATLLIDYRLAPEHPFPSAIDDSARAYQWLLAQGISPDQIVLAGDSAGGGLVLATLLALRDRGAPLPDAAVLISPWTDLTASGGSVQTKADADPAINAAMLQFFRDAYLGDEEASNPLASPLFADLTGLPPLLIQVGTHEILLDDATRLAMRAALHDVDTTLRAWSSMFHVWHFYVGVLPEADAAIEEAGRFMQRQLATP